jgi:hypothetical protein
MVFVIQQSLPVFFRRFMGVKNAYTLRQFLGQQTGYPEP